MSISIWPRGPALPASLAAVALPPSLPTARAHLLTAARTRARRARRRCGRSVAVLSHPLLTPAHPCSAAPARRRRRRSLVQAHSWSVQEDGTPVAAAAAAVDAMAALALQWSVGACVPAAYLPQWEERLLRRVWRLLVVLKSCMIA